MYQLFQQLFQNQNIFPHSTKLFKELRLSSNLTKDQNFCRFFSGDISVANYPMSPVGWATGYALSIYGTEYTQQCPFGTGNGYGDGRAISIFEGLFNGKRMEMQLKGGELVLQKVQSGLHVKKMAELS